MAHPLDLCDSPISCHCWSPDGSMLAMCPNTNELLIYSVAGKKTELKYTLNEHTQVISGVDWHPKEKKIVTCSHDRNAYVWTYDQKEDIWRKDLVILKLKRAATYVRWSPDGTKFVVATGTGKCRVCIWQEEHKWWNAASINHVFPTGLTCDFFKDGKHILISTTSRHCQYLTTDEEELAKKGKKGKKFNHILNDFKSQGWSNCSAISPSESWIAYSSQDSYIRFVKNDELTADDPPTRALNINGLPLLSMVFLSDKCLVGAGFDCAPRLFYLNGEEWNDLGLLDIPEIREASTGAAKGGIASKMAAFGGKPAAPAAAKGIHNNIILEVRLCKGGFSCCANDGIVSVWPLEPIKKHFAGKNLF